jgi:hypothetical protein
MSGEAPEKAPALGHVPTTDVLAEASPASLSELFARDPEGYSDQDLDVIIEELRRQRARFKTQEATPKASKPKAIKAPVALSAIVGSIAGALDD